MQPRPPYSTQLPSIASRTAGCTATKSNFAVVIDALTTIGGLVLSTTNVGIRADLPVTGATTWDGPTSAFGDSISFSSAPTVRPAGPVRLTGDSAKGLTATGVLDLASTTTWTGNTSAGANRLTVDVSVFSSGAVIRNRGVFDNQGNFVKSGAAVTQMDIADFRNAGLVTLTAGTLDLSTMSGVHTGSWQVNAGAVLDLSGGTPTVEGFGRTATRWRAATRLSMGR